MKKIALISIAIFTAILSLGVYFVQNIALVFPIWANDVAKSDSMREIDIVLSARKEGSSNIAKFRIPRAYIDWKPYLDGKARRRIHIDAALPDLYPYSIWKRDYLNSIKDSKGNVSSDEKNAAHQQWVKIEFGVFVCDYECSQTEHNEKVLKFHLKNYDKFISEESQLGLKVFSSTSTSPLYKGHTFYLPIDPNIGHFFIDCVRVSALYKWCNVSTLLNNNMSLSYKFEAKYLAEWKEIDSKVRKLVNEMLISHKMDY